MPCFDVIALYVVIEFSELHRHYERQGISNVGSLFTFGAALRDLTYQSVAVEVGKKVLSC